MALINGKKPSVEPANLKVEDASLSTFTSYRGCPFRRIMATSGLRGNHACGCQRERRCYPRKFDAVSGARRQQDTCHPKTRKSRGWRAHLHFQQVACRRRPRQGTLEAVGKEIPSQSAESHSFVGGTKVILNGLTALPGWQDFEKLNINSGKDPSGPDERAQAGRENHKFGGCSDSPVFFSPKNYAGSTQHTRTTVNTIEVEAENPSRKP